MGKLFYLISAVIVFAIVGFINVTDKSQTEQFIAQKAVIEENLGRNLSDEQMQIVEKAALEFNNNLEIAQKEHEQWYMVFGDDRIKEIKKIIY